MSCVRPYVIGIVSSFIASALWALLVWLNRNGLANWLAKNTNWKRSGDAWWLACELHSIKLHAGADHISRISNDISQALRHAEAMGMNDEVLSTIRELRDTYAAKQKLTDPEKQQIQEQVDS